MSRPSGGLRKVKCVATGVTAFVVLTGCAAAAELAESARTLEQETTAPRPEPQPEREPEPPPEPDPAPDTGCRRLSIDDLATVVDDSPVVGCRKPHTVYTYDVGKLPPRILKKGTLSPARKRVQNAARRGCDTTFRTWIAGTDHELALTMLDTEYFLPDRRQFRLGAPWVRCDVFAYAVDDGGKRALSRLPNGLKGGMKDPRIRDRVGRCGNVDPGRNAFRAIICAKPHNWRAVDTFVAGRRAERWPGVAQLQERGRNRCQPKVRAWVRRAGIDRQVNFNAIPFDKASWESGTRYGLCWAQTRQ
ncbi:MAG: hypothetical protein GEU93_00245 [Propionibacteriales bacterium]|nr:hypothetical protein [Propionibacteriales bacterium]